MVSHNSPCPGLVLGWLKTKTNKMKYSVILMSLSLKILGISHLVNSPCPGLVEAYGTTRVAQNKAKTKQS